MLKVDVSGHEDLGMNGCRKKMMGRGDGDGSDRRLGLLAGAQRNTYCGADVLEREGEVARERLVEEQVQESLRIMELVSQVVVGVLVLYYARQSEKICRLWSKQVLRGPLLV